MPCTRRRARVREAKIVMLCYSYRPHADRGAAIATAIRVFGITPDLMAVTFIGSAFWMLACMVVAVKSALDYESLWKALGVVIVAWLFQAFFLFLVLLLFRGI